jgi:subtilase family serine protease
MRRLILALVFLILLALILSACPSPSPDTEKPDLVPVMAPGNSTFCEIEGGNLKVYVKNQGDTEATGSEVEVEFYLQGGVQQTERAATGPISAGGTDSVLIPIPAGCYIPDCNFQITVDIVNVIEESNENNNVAQGACIG